MTPAPLEHATVTIVGLGLLGGSLGLALQGNCGRRIGWDIDTAAAAAAVAAGAIDETLELDDAVAAADIVVLAAPVSAIVELAPRIAAQMSPGALLTDLGSTKAAVAAAFDALPAHVAAIGSHPMRGGTTSGVSAADGSLYDGAAWAVTPGSRTLPADALARLEELITAVGASPLRMTPQEHDEAAARVSHLPYVQAQALLGVLAHSEPSEPAVQLAAAGFRGATRMAGGDVDMWHAILTTNAPAVRAAISEQITQLEALAALLDDPEALRVRLARGRELRERLTSG